MDLGHEMIITAGAAHDIIIIDMYIPGPGSELVQR